MSVLMVGPYPPTRDGIASYALQQVAALRTSGEDVRVLSPAPSAAHEHLDPSTRRGALALGRRFARYDRVVLQFHPDTFYPLPKTYREWAVQSLALALAFRRARRLEVHLHEIDYRDGRRRGGLGVASRLMWRAVDTVYVHTERERDDFVAAFGVPRARVVVSAHGAFFRRGTSADRERARRSLGLPADVTVFLAIGFIQPHKGFDRAVASFAGLHEHGARLDIVGSVRLEDPGVEDYVAGLRRAVTDTPGAHLHLGYVSDEVFDRWLVAADVVVLPYRSIWSSGVLARAALYDRPVIATAVGGLVDQARDRRGVSLVADDEELRAALWRAAGAPGEAPAGWPAPATQPNVQAAVVARAARRRGLPRPGGRAAERAGALSTAPLRRLPPADVPTPTSARLVAAVVKRVVRRLTLWEVQPLVNHVNALHSATVASVEQVAKVTAADDDEEPAQGD